MRKLLRVACLQFTPGPDISANLAQVERFARAAARAGAQLIALPEYALALSSSSKLMRNLAAPEEHHPGLEALRDLARKLDVWLLAGSLTVKTSGEKIANRSYLIDQLGTVRAQYDKLHMFDVVLPDGRAISESRTYSAGNHACVASVPIGTIGLTICYDLRFPQLFRTLAKAGAQIITVPAAFDSQIGHLHWHLLLRARAVETSCYIVAPATCGHAPGGPSNFGHSLIIDPKGKVLADAGAGSGWIAADLDMNQPRIVREGVPSLQHDRTFELRKF